MLLPALDVFGTSKEKSINAQTAEFHRIQQLPWLNWYQHVTHNQGHLRLTTALKTPYGEQALWPIQAAVLTYLHDYGGVFGAVPVGQGKTLSCFLAPRVWKAQRPALFIPAELHEKTWREFQLLFKHWFGPTVFMRRKTFNETIFHYQELSRESGRSRLEEYGPDLICADEVQALKNRGAACTKTVEDFMYRHHQTRFVALSGTPTSRNPMEFWHIMFWCLRHLMPMPRDQSEAQLWSSAVAETKEISVNRPDGSALYVYLSPEDQAKFSRPASTFENLDREVDKARTAFSNRLASAPGVIVYEDESSVHSSLRIRQLRWTPGAPAQFALSTLRATRHTPNGVELETPMDVWRMARQLACGFYYLWDPPPPEEWMARRRRMHWYYRNILDREGVLYLTYLPLKLFSPADVANAIVQGRIKDAAMVDAYYAWTAIQPTYVYERIAIWIDDAVLNRAADWIRKERGIVWTEHRAFGFKLSEITGVGFCTEQGLDQQGVLIDDYRGAPVIAGFQSNYRGRNLQAWNKSLAVTIPPNGAKGEQFIGRTHRPGQLEDVVHVDMVMACEEQEQGFDQMLADARYIEKTTKQKQKLNFADHV